MIRKLLAAAALGAILLAPPAALAQSSPGFVNGQVPTASQWNSIFAGKQNYNPNYLLGPGSTGFTPGDLAVFGTYPQIVDGGALPTITGLGAVTVTGCPACVVSIGSNPSLTGQVQTQGFTTTSPGFYAQVTGDAYPRVRVGLNNTDIASIAFGPGSAVRDTFLERLSAGYVRWGAPDAAAPVAQGDTVQNVVAGTTNTAGAARVIAGSRGTGTGCGGNLTLQIAPAGSTGSTQNALQNTLVLNGCTGAVTGAVSFGAPTLASTVTTGTPPLSVSSTTNVPNLNASSLNGSTFAAPGPIGSTTPSTGAFSTVSAAAGRSTQAALTIATATFTPNFDTAADFTIGMTSACPCTLANPSTTPVAGQKGVIFVTQDATGSRTFGTWGSSYVAAGGTSTITLTTAANATDVISYVVKDATHIVLSLGAANVSH